MPSTNWTPQTINSTNWTAQSVNSTNWIPVDTEGMSTSAMLMETGDILLLESGDYIMIENYG